MTDLQGQIGPIAQEMDNQLRAINNVQGSWNLPGLPDEVALDLLAAPEITSPSEQTEFLQGLDSDLADALRPQASVPKLQLANETPLVEVPAEQVPGRFQARNSYINDIRRIYAGVAGLRAPQIVASDPDQAVWDLKVRAIEAGLLDPATPIDGSWNPSMNSIRYDLMQNEVRDRLQGDKPGAVQSMAVLDTLDKWMSPSSLVGSLLTQQLLWDPSKINDEFENWGEGISAWLDDPFDLSKFGRALGPVDDIVMPAVNLYLMASGFRSVLVFANAARAMRAGQTAAQLGASSQRLGRAAAEVQRFQQPGLLAGRWLDRPGGVRASLGRGMSKWRQFHGVAMTKKAVQQGARSGFVGQLGAELSPDSQGLSLLGQTGPVKARMDDFRNYRTDNVYGLAAMFALDLSFAPRTIFAEGRFGQLAGRAISSSPGLAGQVAVGVVAGTGAAVATDGDLRATAGSAAAGMLAAKGASGYVKRMLHIADDEQTTYTLLNAMLTKYEGNPARAETVQNAIDLMKVTGRNLPKGEKDGTQRALYYLLTGDESLLAVDGKFAPISEATKIAAGEQATFITVAAAVDKAARATAASIADDSSSAAWLDAYYQARKHFISRLRPYEMDQIDFDDQDQILAFIQDFSGRRSLDTAINDQGEYDFFLTKSQAQQNADTAADALVDRYINDPDEFKQFAQNVLLTHDDYRAATMADIFDGIEASDIFTYVMNQVDDFDKWDDFTMASGLLQSTVMDLDNLTLVGKGTKLKSDWMPSGLESDIWANLGDWNPDPIKPLNAIQKNLRSGGDVQITLMKADSWTKQDVLRIKRRLESLKEIRRRLTEPAPDLQGEDFGSLYRFRFGRSIEDFADTKGKGVGDLTDKEITEWINLSRGPNQLAGPPNSVAGVSTKTQKEFAQTARWLAANKLTPEEALRVTSNQIDQIAQSPNWGNMGGNRIRHLVPDDTSGGVRLRNVDEMISDINRNEKYVAAEIEVPDALRQQLLDRGYKPVAGRGFLYADDISDLNGGPLAEISRKRLREISFGNLFSRDLNTYPMIKAQRTAQTVSALQKYVVKAMRSGTWDGPTNFDPTNPRVYEQIYQQMTDTRLAFLESRTLAAREKGGWWQDTKQRFANAGLPYTPNDLSPDTVRLALNGDPDLMVGAAPLYGPKAVDAVVAGLREGKVMPFQQDGLQALNDLMVSQSWLRGALNAMSYSGVNEAGKQVGKVGRAFNYLGVGAAPTRNTLPGNQLNLWKQWQRIGVASLSGAAAYAQTDGDLTTTLGAAGFGGLMPQPQASFYPRMAVRTLAGVAGTQVATAEGASERDSLLVGLGAATLGVGFGRKAITAAMKPGAVLDKRLANYSRLGDKFVRLRDEMRFSLSPFFDLSRYTEGMMLAATADAPVPLPISTNPLKVVAKQYNMNKSEIIAQYRAASGGQDYLDVMDQSQAWFFERGILNFSPTEWMAASHQRLVQSGMDPVQAADKVREIYTYGTRGRSAAEKTANFIFFPFSFQKKYLGALAKHISHDLTRQTVIHDSLKMYEVLSEHSGFDEWVADHMPVLKQFRRLNTLGYGISAGQLGGINRTAMDLARSTPVLGQQIDATANIFLPQALRIESEQDLEQVQYQVERMMPIWRDASLMFEDIMNQGHVMTSPSHLSREAETRRGWEEFDNLRADLTSAAHAVGVSPQQMFSGQGQYAAVGAWYQRQLTDLARQYPEWNDSRVQGYQNAVMRSDEIRRIVSNPATPAEQAMVRFDQIVDYTMSATQPASGDWTQNTDLIDAQVTSALRNEAIRIVQQVPDFGRLYKMYYQNRLGPIHLDLR